MVLVQSEAMLAKKRAHVYILGGWDRRKVLEGMERVSLPSHKAVPRPRLPQPRFDFGCAYDQNTNFYVGGGYDKHKKLLDTIVMYHTGYQVWKTLPRPLSCPMAGVSMVVYEGRLYCMGGFDGKEYFPTMQVLDLFTNTWITRHPKTKAPFPEMEQARAFAAVAVIEKEIHLFGGHNREDGDLHTVEVYNPVLNTWEEACPMPTPRRKCAAAVVQVAKGKSSSELVVVVGGSKDRQCLKTAEAYHPEHDSWTRLPDMLHRREGCGAVGIGKDLVVLGGASGRFNVLDSMERLRVQKYLKGAMEFYLHDGKDCLERCCAVLLWECCLVDGDSVSYLFSHCSQHPCSFVRSFVSPSICETSTPGSALGLTLGMEHNMGGDEGMYDDQSDAYESVAGDHDDHDDLDFGLDGNNVQDDDDKFHHDTPPVIITGGDTGLHDEVGDDENLDGVMDDVLDAALDGDEFEDAIDGDGIPAEELDEQEAAPVQVPPSPQNDEQDEVFHDAHTTGVVTPQKEDPVSTTLDEAIPSVATPSRAASSISILEDGDSVEDGKGFLERDDILCARGQREGRRGNIRKANHIVIRSFTRRFQQDYLTKSTALFCVVLCCIAVFVS